MRTQSFFSWHYYHAASLLAQPRYKREHRTNSHDMSHKKKAYQPFQWCVISRMISLARHIYTAHSTLYGSPKFFHRHLKQWVRDLCINKWMTFGRPGAADTHLQQTNLILYSSCSAKAMQQTLFIMVTYAMRLPASIMTSISFLHLHSPTKPNRASQCACSTPSFADCSNKTINVAKPLNYK